MSKHVETISPFNASHALCVAPMMDYTDRHCRHLHRLFAPKAMLYTEMVVAQAIVHGNAAERLDFKKAVQPNEGPMALQLGGNDPEQLAFAARFGEAHGYNEINLNVGCPSDRVKEGVFGACLMADAHRVAELVNAMKQVVSVPVTVKCRLGLDDETRYEFLADFVRTVHGAGCDTFIVHARNAILSGLSPKQNREIPPLRYHFVQQLKQEFPHLTVILNGGLADLQTVQSFLPELDGVMLGRAAYHQPALLSDIHRWLWPDIDVLDEWSIAQAYRDYGLEQINNGVRPSAVWRHMTTLFHGQPGARHFRRIVSTTGKTPEQDTQHIDAALEAMANSLAQNMKS